MRFALVSIICTMGLAACDVGPHATIRDGFCETADMKVTTADMPPSSGTCAAAQGLSGTNLICVDFSSVSGLTDQRLSGWDFSCIGGATWTTSGGMLQVNSFATFDRECTATLPASNLNDADKSKYKSLALSIVQRIDLNDPEQAAQIFLNDSSKAPRLMYQGTGKKDVPRQKTVIFLDKADLPANINNSPQWRLKLSSSLAVGRNGWQIESIAINLIP